VNYHDYAGNRQDGNLAHMIDLADYLPLTDGIDL
jgi:hypothetical protein